MHVLDKRLLLLRVQPYTSHEKERQRLPNRKRHSSSNLDYDTCKAMWYSKHGKVKACRPKQVVPNCRVWDCCRLLKQTSQRGIQHKTKFRKKSSWNQPGNTLGLNLKSNCLYRIERWEKPWIRAMRGGGQGRSTVLSDKMQSKDKATKNGRQKGPKLKKHRHRCKGWWKW